MDVLRGRVPLNANDASKLYRSKKSFLHADLHHNKNHNIFEDGYNKRTVLNDSMEPVEVSAYVQASNPNAIELAHYNSSPNRQGNVVGAGSPATSLRKSPTKEKYGKIGALYNPNNIDPRSYEN